MFLDITNENEVKKVMISENPQEFNINTAAMTNVDV